MIHKILCLKLRIGHIFYLMFCILCLINGLVFIYKLLIDIQNVQHLYQLGIPLNLALYTGILAIMCEVRPRNTPQQIEYDDSIIDRGFNDLTLLSIINTIIIIATLP